MKDFIEANKQDAKWWFDKYPFLRIKNNSVYPWLEIGSDECTWIDELPKGWIMGFCEKMCDELMDALGDYADEWIILQVKEKFAELRIYHAGCPSGIYEKVESIINKYTKISYNTCSVCGARATKHSDGWVLPYCDKCYKKWVMKE